MKRFGAAIVGTGFMGWVHAEALRRANVDVVGVLGSTPEKSASSAAAWNARKAYDTFESILGDDDVSAIHIGTPNRFHFEMARDALLAGKHVMCEKPLGMNSHETAQLVKIANDRPQLVAAVNYNIRFYPLCLEARERIRNHSLGDVFHVTGSYVQDWLLKPTDYNWRVLDSEGGTLRAVADIGTHWLDLMHMITGLRVDAVFADLQTVHAKRIRPSGEIETFSGKTAEDSTGTPIEIKTDDYGCVMLRFQGGARGCLHVSQVTAGRKNCLRFEIAGSKESIAWNSERPNDIWIGHRDHANEMLHRDPALLSAQARTATDYPGGHNEGYSDSFKQCFKAFYDYLGKGDFQAEPTFATFEDGHREVSICEAVLKSASEGRWCKVHENRLTA